MTQTPPPATSLPHHKLFAYELCLSLVKLVAWIEACPRAVLVVAILRRIAYTMLALFRSVTQRSDERRATPWQTLMTDLFIALITTTDNELRKPKPLRTR